MSLGEEEEEEEARSPHTPACSPAPIWHKLSLCCSVSKQKAFLPLAEPPIGCCCLWRKLQACAEQHRCEHAQSSTLQLCKEQHSSRVLST